MIDTQAAARFRRLGTLTILAVYLVILMGGIVRASGAGMGCPDWPTCFGRWVPPTSEAQLPADYHQIYAARGYQTTLFNPVKTWTEYLNRLVGASTGLLVLLTAWSSRIYRQSDRAIFRLAVAAFLLIGFQGWLGSAVVASNLTPLMITAHMLMALLIVALLIYAIARSQQQLLAGQDVSGLPPRFGLVLKLAMAMTLLQVAMGTQVREAVDFISHQHGYIDRQFWRDSFPVVFYVHRSFSSLILLTNLWLGWQVYRAEKHRLLPGAAAPLWRVPGLCAAGRGSLLLRTACLLVLLIVTAILAGVSLDRLGFPAVAQPVHLLMANLIFGAQFFLFICLRRAAGGKA